MKYTGAKVRLSRQLGIAITPKAARVMDRKPYPPGEHGRDQQFKKGRPSVYKEQLIEKQRLRAQYNISEKQLRNYYMDANRREGNTGENLIQLLESRLDAAVLHGGLATTIYAARQYVNHGHVQVNGRKVNIPSYQLKPGDVVTVKQQSQRLECFQVALDQARPPDYLKLSRDELKVTYLNLPQVHEVPIVCELPRVVEFYSR